MIELPTDIPPNSFEGTILDFGFLQRGAASLRINRPGNRHRITLSWPPLEPDRAARLLARIKRGKRQGLRARLPLLRPQGLPGSPVVDGNDQAGSRIAVRGMTPGYAAREDYWLTIVEADGTPYLHSVERTVIAGSDGRAIVEIEPPLRAPFADGDRVEFGAPFVEGAVDGEEYAWVVPVSKRIVLSVSIEEYA